MSAGVGVRQSGCVFVCPCWTGVNNPSPSPCRWQPAEQHQPLPASNPSLSLLVQLAVSAAATAAALLLSALAD